MGGPYKNSKLLHESQVIFKNAFLNKVLDVSHLSAALEILNYMNNVLTHVNMLGGEDEINRKISNNESRNLEKKIPNPNEIETKIAPPNLKNLESSK